MHRSPRKLGEILIDKGLITEGQLKEVLAEQLKSKDFLGAILIKSKRVSESDLLAALAEQFNMPFCSLRHRYIDWGLVKSFSASLILEYKCFPVSKQGNVVTMAITNPLDAWAIKKAEEEAQGATLKLVLVTQDDLQSAIKRYRQCIQKNTTNLV